MSYRIKTITLNGKVLAADDNTLIKRVVYNGTVIWSYNPTSSNLVIATYGDGTYSLYDETKAAHLSESTSGGYTSTIKKIVYNGEQIWPSTTEDYLNIEKDHVYLNWTNNYTDTNTIYTNLTFTIN